MIAALFGAILVVGTALRVMALERFPFEQDELYTAVESTFLWDSPLNPGIEARPLYYLIQHPILDVFPVTHLSMRILPLLFGVAGIWATWALARKLFGDAPALVAAALVALSPWHLYISGMGRYWALVYLLATLFALFFVEAVETDEPKAWIKALIAGLLGLTSHPTFLFTAAGFVLGSLMVRADGRFGFRMPSRNALKFLWGPGAAALLLAFVALQLTGNEGAVRNWSGRGLAASLRLVPAIVEWMSPAVFVAGGLGMLLMIVARTVAPERRAWAVMALCGSGAVVSALFVMSFATNVYADYAVSALPLILVSAAGLVALLPERSPVESWATAFVAGAVLCAAASPSTVSYLSDGSRFDYRPAFDQIEGAGGDVAVLSTPIVIQRHYAPDLRGLELRFERDSLDAALAAEPDLWAIVGVRRYGLWQDDQGVLAGWLDEHCNLRGSHQRSRLDYRMYRTDLYRCGTGR